MKMVAYLTLNNEIKFSNAEKRREAILAHKNSYRMTLEEFEAGFNTEQISDLGWIAFYDIDTAEERDAKRLENAKIYLCDSDLSVEEQLKLINDEEDSERDLSDIEGVVEWEPVQGRFNVGSFLELIEPR